MSFVVAIDGPAGSGKGTVTKLVGEKEGLIYIDTGAMYRCVTLYMIKNSIKITDTEKINELLKNIKIEFKKENNEDKVYLNDEDVSKQISRDIGTNVFPNAEIKIYLDATPEERANRRIRQNKEKGIESTYEEVLENIKFRDNNDKTSKVAPLKQADDAIYLDTTKLQISEVVEKICGIIESSEKWKSKKKLTKKDLRKIKKQEKRNSMGIFT